MRPWLSIVLVLAGCRGEAVSPGEASRTRSPMDEAIGEEVSEPAPTPRRARMHERFDTIGIARAALVRGDHGAARNVLSTITWRFGLDLPASARRHGDEVPRLAIAASSASDLAGTASGLARIVGACGGCHEAAGTTWAWDETPLPEGEDLDARMRRHAWASERMEEALLVRSTERFERAADVLAAAPLSGEAPPDEERPGGIRALEEQLRAAGTAGRAATTWEARADVYGTVLGTCAGCHQRVREPGP